MRRIAPPPWRPIRFRPGKRSCSSKPASNVRTVPGQEPEPMQRVEEAARSIREIEHVVNAFITLDLEGALSPCLRARGADSTW